MKSSLLALLVLAINDPSYAQATKVEGIFDRFMKKVDEKEEAAAAFDVMHMKNELLAEKQAALISAGEVDQNVVGGATIDDELSAGIDKLAAVPIKQLAGVNKDKQHKEETKKFAQSLVQKKGKQPVVIEEDEDRDDFEGFGSITAMAQHKDELIDKKMADPDFKKDVEAQEKAKKDAEEKVKKDKEALEQAEKDEKKKAMMQRLSQAKAKMEAALNKATPKAQISTFKPMPKVHIKPVAAPAAPAIAAPQPVISTAQESVSSSAYQKAIASVLQAQQQTPKPARVFTVPTPVPEPVAADTASGNSEEEAGFIGKYSKKIEATEKAKAEQSAYAEVMSPTIPLSKDAPKHKGMLARAMERDMKEQEAADQKEKDQLMNEALNDPSFKSQMENLKTKNAFKQTGLI